MRLEQANNPHSVIDDDLADTFKPAMVVGVDPVGELPSISPMNSLNGGFRSGELILLSATPRPFYREPRSLMAAQLMADLLVSKPSPNVVTITYEDSIDPSSKLLERIKEINCTGKPLLVVDSLAQYVANEHKVKPGVQQYITAKEERFDKKLGVNPLLKGLLARL